MGDRAQVLIEDTGVYLYTHWNGYRMVDDVKEALASDIGRRRWSDEEYLTRIIFDKMTETEHGEETGFGIGTEMHGDLGYPVLRVNCKDQTVTVPGQGQMTFREFTGRED